MELKTSEMRTFTTADRTSSVPSTPYTQVVTTPSETEVVVSSFPYLLLARSDSRTSTVEMISYNSFYPP